MTVYHPPTNGFGGKDIRYHTNEDCRYIERINNVQTKPEELVPETWIECKLCAQEFPEKETGGDRSLYETLENNTWDEVIE